MKSKSIKILIIDDNISFVDSIKLYLKEIEAPKGYRIYRNFSKFFEEWDKKERFDCYMFDNDADLNTKGIEVIKDFISNYGEDRKKFVLFSSKEVDFGKRIKEIGIKFFQKPLKPKELVSYVKTILRQEENN